MRRMWLRMGCMCSLNAHLMSVVEDEMHVVFE